MLIFKQLKMAVKNSSQQTVKHNTMMKKWAPVVFTIFVYSAKAQISNQQEDDGQYYPDDEGRYIEDNSGQYIPDNSGLYQDDGTGRYSGDNSGYYRNVEDKYRYQKQNQFNSLSKGNYASATSVKSQFVQPKSRQLTQPTANSANAIPTEPEKYGKFDDNRWKIIKLFNDVKNDGYHWEYETENEISGQENAKIFNGGTKDEALRTKGFYQYTGADNKIYNVEYTADENGFIPRGKHLHPILQKAILDNLNRKNDE